MNKISYLVFMTLLLISSIFAQETTIIQDDLQGNTSGTQVGGSFTSEGYKPGVGFNHILYDVPSQVVNGYVEFQIKGFDPSALPADADNGFAGLYDGRGISEPIQYFDDFKYNFFRWNFHWRENKDAFKAVISVAAPTSSRLNATKAVYTLDNSPDDGSGNPVVDWHTEPTGNGWTFNSTTWYTIKIEWKNKNFKIYANNTVVWSTSGPYDYAPIDFKVWLGCAPGSNNKYKNQSASIVYRNFKIVSYGQVQVTTPASPSNLTANTAGSTQIDLNWTDNSNNEDGFKIERKSGSGGSWSQIATTGSNVTTYQNTGLSSGTTYYYRVRAYNSAGNSSYSNEANATTTSSTTLPASPSNLTANAMSSTQINLSWTDNADDEDGFKIERKTGSGGSWSQIATTGSNVTTYQNTGLSSGTTYYYRVRAYNSAGNSSYSNEANATTTSGVNIPTSPSNLTADAVSDAQINLSWTDNSNNEVGFKIERKTGSGGSWSQIATTGSNVTTYQNTRLSSGTTYYYRVRSYNSAGNSSYSNEANATTTSGATIPSAPSDLTANIINNSQVSLHWVDNSDNEDGFKIFREIGSSDSVDAVIGVEADVTEYLDTNLNPNTEYYYRVKSYNAEGYSSNSNIVGITISITIPSGPANLTATAINSRQINLNWSDNSDNEDGFKIERKTDSNSNWLQIGMGEIGDTLYQDTSLTPNTTYYYRVRAYNSVGNSNYSNEANAKTDDIAPIAPGNLTATAISNTQINLSWTDNSENEDGFKIERKIELDGNWMQIALVESNNTLYQDTSSIISNKTYYYRVTAYNSIGSSDYSNEVNVVITGIRNFEYNNYTVKDYILYDNYPNPFNPSTTIKFGIPEESSNALKIYDITGREVAQILNNEPLPAGVYKFKFNSNNLPSGIYLCVLTSTSNITGKNFRSVKKMILLK